MQTDTYIIYARYYVKKYNDMIFWLRNGLLQPPIDYGGTNAQIFAKVQVWAAANRPQWYVKEILKLDDLSASGQQVLLYKEFLRLKQELLEKKVEAL
ncbi:hypothetical protein JG687_00012665 [Phytophthora cactorum]|uniref:Uncharacterized protein n=1 Tax=Phytophthora cactorum TaxID=29920 RepID=A0A8T1U164_9STRA|nr:hypothetical protein JG687_00012665 [Phytophthora cactorum]